MHQTEHSIVEAAERALVGIVAALPPADRPAQLGHVTLVVRDYERNEATRPPILATTFLRWRHEAPPETVDEASFRAATIDPSTQLYATPVWTFELTPVAEDDWYFTHAFAAPVRKWLGESAGSRVKAQGLLFRARREGALWCIDVEDILFMV